MPPLTRRLLPAALVAGVLGISLASAQSRKASDAALQAVRKEIKALEANLARQVTERDDTAKALRAAELEIVDGASKLDAVRAELKSQQTQQRSIGLQVAKANQRLAAERRALGQQVRVSYINGRQEVFKLLLSQESPATLGRMLVYYDYFNRARSVRIAAVATDVQALEVLEADADRVRQQLAALLAAQAGEVAALSRSRDERRALVTKQEAAIADGGTAIAKLRGEEKRLADVMKQLGALAAGFPVDTDQPFARLKGKLVWPIQGRLVGDYGQPRGGGPVKWNGVLLEASQGTPVRAIYQGRVAFADWLPGLGQLVIVDHGDGYMSLYGHNAALLKEAGDSVETGEPIAKVGDTGGQPRPALYFEIRKNGEPVNPHQWIPQKTSR